MHVLLAFDKFKDALTAGQAGAAAAAALRAKHPDWSLDVCPLTDGGEGFCPTLTQAAGGQLEFREVAGPRGGHVNAPIGFVRGTNLPPAVCARLGLAPDATLAIIEMASASGLDLLPPGQRDPWQTSSHGTGEQIQAATKAGAVAILLGVGGSATNDLGLGALTALGYKFLDDRSVPVEPPVPVRWEDVARIDCISAARVPPIFIACDVTNPLLGPHGATATYGPQKGLIPADLPRLEASMKLMAAQLAVACDQPLSLAGTPGAGAAGGIAFGLMVACGAKLIPGFDLVSDWLDLPGRLARADLVITGEGRFDATSLTGKGPGRIVAEARRLGKPVQVFAGSLGVPAGGPAAADETIGLHAITPAGMPLTQALPRTAELLAAAVREAL